MTRTNESKHDKFVRLAEARTNKIIDTLQLLGNCANTSVYEYDKAEVNEIFQAIEKELQLTKLFLALLSLPNFLLVKNGCN